MRVGRWWYIEPLYSESFYYNTGLTLLFLRQTLPCCVIRVNAREHRDKRSRFFRSFLQNAQFSGTSPETIFFSFFLFFLVTKVMLFVMDVLEWMFSLLISSIPTNCLFCLTCKLEFLLCLRNLMTCKNSTISFVLFINIEGNVEQLSSS